MQANIRHCHLLPATSGDDARRRAIELRLVSSFDSYTFIDTSTDYNQNKWLGLELGDTLIYFDEHTGINQLLSVWGCVRGGADLVLAFKEPSDNNSASKSYFYQQILLPELVRVVRCNCKHSSDSDIVIPQKKSANQPNKAKVTPLISWYSVAPSLRIAMLLSQTRLVPENYWRNWSLLNGQTITKKIFSIYANIDNVDLHPAATELLQKALPIVHLIGERGTGKSTLLGGVCGIWLANKKPILLCSPSIQSSKNTLAVIPESVSRETLQFVSPSALTKNMQTLVGKETLLIIDEASSCPQNVINRAVQLADSQQQKLILSTTVEGYEGTGQGYRLAYLNNTPYPIHTLRQPRRFSADDPLHLLAKHFANPQTNQKAELTEGISLYLTKQLREKHMVEAVFGLLRSAHYKTTPNDLRRFYDDDAIIITVVKDNRLVAALYAILECLPNDVLFEDIYYGRRRVKTALTQQSLINAYGEKQILNKKIIRVNRIAVDDRYRRKKIATQMLSALKQYAKKHTIDAISTSFSTTDTTLRFWHAQQAQAVRVGLYANKWLDSYALLMLIPLTAEMCAITSSLQQHFYRHINFFVFYPAIINNLKDLSQDHQTTPKISTDTVINSIKSVVAGHRDIHWALPLVIAYLKQQKQPHNTAFSDEKINLCRNRLSKTQQRDITLIIKQIIDLT